MKHKGLEVAEWETERVGFNFSKYNYGTFFDFKWIIFKILTCQHYLEYLFILPRTWEEG